MGPDMWSTQLAGTASAGRARPLARWARALLTLGACGFALMRAGTAPVLRPKSAPMSQSEVYDLKAPGGKLRLFTEHALAAGASIEPTAAQAHYLLHVVRAKAGDTVRLFNGCAGEWRAKIAQVSRRACVLQCEARIA